MEKAMVYYTRDGSTGIAAGILAKKTGALPVQLEPQKKLRNFIVSGFLSARKKNVELSGDPWGDTAEAETLILAAPVWAGNGNPVMNSFINKADFSGKKIYLLTVQADPKTDSSEKVLPQLCRTIEGKGGTIASVLAIHGSRPGKTASEDHIRRQLENWRID